MVMNDDLLPNIKNGNYIPIEQGDLVLADASEDYSGIAEPCVILHEPKKKIIAGLHTIAIRPINTNHLYLYYLLHTKEFKKFGSFVGTGLKVFGITFNNFAKYETKMPMLPEQTSIGNFFRTMDNTIALYKRQAQNLKQLKKAYLQQMFPQERECVPKVRFKGFKGDWEQCKLGELSEITTGKLDANAMVNDGEFDFYTSGIKKYKIDKPAFNGPAITVAGNGATVGYMHLADGQFNAYQRTYVLTKFKANRCFLFSEIGNKLPRKITEEARTGNIPYIVMDMLADLIIQVPKKTEEQILIGNFFYNLDTQLSIQVQKIDRLRQLKSAYLQKMFV